MKYSIPFIIGLLVMFGDFANAQTLDELAQKQLPSQQYKAPVDVTAMIDKYSTDIDCYTGQLNVSIPLVKFELDGFQMAYSADYHAGLKVAEVSGPLGAGWRLQGGAMITREIRGRSDFQTNYEPPIGDTGYDAHGILSEENRNLITHIGNESDAPGAPCDIVFENGETTDDEDLLEAIVGGQFYSGTYDTEPDIFTLITPSITCRFAFTSSDNIIFETDRRIDVLEYPTSEFDTWKIRTDDGMVYKFGGDNHQNVDFHSIPAGSLNGPLLQEVVSTWHVSHIWTPLNHEIEFEYIQNNYVESEAMLYQRESDLLGENVLGDDHFFVHLFGFYLAQAAPLMFEAPSTGGDINIVGSLVRPSNLGTANNITISNIASVHFEDGLIQRGFNFNYSFNRADFPTLPVLRLIESTIGQMASPSTYIQQKVGFEFDLLHFRPWLTSITFASHLSLDDVFDENPPFYFQYNNYQNFPTYSSLSQDYYGFYNGRDNAGKSFVPKHLANEVPFTVPTIMWGDYPNEAIDWSSDLSLEGSDLLSDRSVDADYAIRGSLSEIITPLGKKLDFEYESNDFIYQQTKVYGGGIRVSKVTEQDIPTLAMLTKKYLYQDNIIDDTGKTTGLVMKLPEFVSMTAGHGSAVIHSANLPNEYYSYLRLSSQDINGYSTSANGSIVGYSSVIVTSESPSANGYEKFEFVNIPDGSPSCTWSGAEYFPLYGTYNLNGSAIPYYSVPNPTHRHLNGKLIGRTTFEFRNNQFYPVVQRRYIHRSIYKGDIHGSKIIFWGSYMPDPQMYYASNWPACKLYTSGYYTDKFYCSNVASSEVVYFDFENFQSSISEKYDYQDGKLTSRTLSKAGHEPIVELTEYPTSGEAYNGTPLDELIEHNRSVPLRKKLIQGQEILSDEITSYDVLGNVTAQYKYNPDFDGDCGDLNIPYAFEKISETTYGANVEVMSVSDANGIYKSFNYDDLSTLSAECYNAKPNEILYCSFETQDFHGIDAVPGSVHLSADAYSGLQSMAVESANDGNLPVIKRLFPTRELKEYTLSFWVKVNDLQGGAVPVLKLHTCQLGATNNVYPNASTAQVELQLIETNGQWKRIEATLDLKEIFGQTAPTSQVAIQFEIYNVSGQQIQIDDLSFYPTLSIFKTYCKGLSGVIMSQSDQRHIKQDFEYDGFGRLLLKKDQYGNILESTDYHFQH